MVDITPDTLRRIQAAFAVRGVREVRLKVEQGQIVVLAVTVKKIENCTAADIRNPKRIE